MNDRDYLRAKEYHKALLIIARLEAQDRRGERHLPYIYEPVLDRLGDLLILLGRKLKERSHAHELSGECV